MNESDGRIPVVVIDDDYVMRLACRQILTKTGIASEAFADGAQGLAAVARLKPEAVLVDLRMPGLSGLEVIARIGEIDPQIVIIVITGYATVDTAVKAMQAGAYDFLPKPFSPEQLRFIVTRGLEHHRLRRAMQRQEVEQALLKRYFVTFVSHQLQNPLVSVRQYLEVIGTFADTPAGITQGAEWITRCIVRIDEMLSLIRDWLTLAKIESGVLIGEQTAVDMRQIVVDLVEQYGAMAAAAQVKLMIQMPAEHYRVRGDRTCIRILVDNLLVNAIKYNKPGGCVVVTADEAANEIVLYIQDTGVGIAPANQARLFDDFFRVRGSGAQDDCGTGLGLPICRRIVTEMGGQLEVSSELGEGSTFRVRLPAYQQPSDVSIDNAGRT